MGLVNADPFAQESAKTVNIVPYEFAEEVEDIYVAWEYEADTYHESVWLSWRVNDALLFKWLSSPCWHIVIIAMGLMAMRGHRRYIPALRTFLNTVFDEYARLAIRDIEPSGYLRTPKVIFGESPLPPPRTMENGMIQLALFG